MPTVYYTHQGQYFPEIKACKKCGTEKSYLEFPEDSYYPGGRGLNCNECLEKRKEESKKSKKLHYLTNQEEINARNKVYYLANREQALESSATYYETHREELRARSLERYHTKKEYYGQKSKEYYETHKDEAREYHRAWYKANATKHAEYTRRRYAKKIAATIGNVDYGRIRERDGTFCYICEQDILPAHKIDFDHVIPLSRGGSHSEENIKVTHHICNRRKNKRLLEEMTPHQRRGIMSIPS